MISSGSNCSGAGGAVQTASVSPAQTFASYDPCYEPNAGPTPVSFRPDLNEWSKGVWMWVDSECKIDPTSHGPMRGTCTGNVARWPSQTGGNPEGKRVLISPAPAGGWPGGRCRREMVPGHVRFEGDCTALNEVLDRCQDPRHSTCSFDFETQTFIDEDGNRWDTSEYNKLAD